MAEKPIKKFSCGLVKCSVWSNEVEREGKKFDMISYKIEKDYQDKDGNWKSTSNYNINELVRLYFLVGEVLRNQIGLKVQE